MTSDLLNSEYRPCTCHPDDSPPNPCPQKFALSECVTAAVHDNKADVMKPHPMLEPTHICKDCGAAWRQCDDFTFNLRGEKACPACDNAPVGGQLVSIASPLIHEINTPRAQLAEAEATNRHRDRQIAAIVTWLEQNQLDVFRRGLWDVIPRATDSATPRETASHE